ncbi:hypothetical protein [Chitinophaga solisilvae]|uniref:hypothetical protein n=1 Tax=Chitinophaga solisilvae TaxID=1233460 RepID=UPI001371EC4A|nr:hypothetical protein [Chitinophaga solisilvae]
MKRSSFLYSRCFLLLAGVMMCSMQACLKSSDDTVIKPEPEPSPYISLINTLSLDGALLDSFEYNSHGKLVKFWHYDTTSKSYNRYHEYVYGGSGNVSGYNYFQREAGSFKLRLRGTYVTAGNKITLYTESFGPDNIFLGKDSSFVLVNGIGQVTMSGTKDTIVTPDPAMGTVKMVSYRNYTYNIQGLQSTTGHFYRSATRWNAPIEEETTVTFAYTDKLNHMYSLVVRDPVMGIYLGNYQYLTAGMLCLSTTTAVINNTPGMKVTYTYTYDNSDQWKEMAINYPAYASNPAHTARYSATYKRIDIK